jgi:hypothetical protein
MMNFNLGAAECKDFLLAELDRIANAARSIYDDHVVTQIANRIIYNNGI